MRIVLTANFSPWSAYHGGGQRSTHFLASALAQRGHDVNVVFTKPPWQALRTPPLPYRVHWAALPDLRGRRDAPLRALTLLTVARRVRALARQARLGVVHAQGEEGALLPDVVRCPFLITSRYPHFPAGIGGARGLRRLRHWLLDTKYLALGRAARRANFVCTTSAAAGALLTRTFALDPALLRVIPNGIDPAFLAVQRARDASAGPIVFFGRVEVDKGIETLLEAYRRTAHQHERALVFVGEGHGLGPLRAAVAANGLRARVQFVAWESSAALSARLARAALAVLPSHHESFGNTMLEALAAGVPLISCDIPALRELVEHGRSGLLVPPRDAARLADAITRLLGDARGAEGMGAHGRTEARARASWDVVASRYEALYEVAQGRRRAGCERSDASLR